jgi:hypothetical protein
MSRTENAPSAVADEAPPADRWADELVARHLQPDDERRNMDRIADQRDHAQPGRTVVVQGRWAPAGGQIPGRRQTAGQVSRPPRMISVVATGG